MINPESGALTVLKNTTPSSSKVVIEGEGKETDFLNSIISKVEAHVDPNSSNPQEAISGIMSSGLITDLVSSLNTGISSGELDLGKMMASVQKMVGGLSDKMGDDPNASQMMNMFSMMSAMNLPK